MSIDINLDRLLERPSRFQKFCTSNNLTTKQFDTLILKQYPDMQKYVDYCDQLKITYGLYPTSHSAVNLRVMADEADIPLTLAGYCAQTLGSAREILDAFRIPYYVIYSNTVFVKKHFYKFFKIRKIQEFEKTLERNSGDVLKTCNELNIDIRKHFNSVIDITNSVTHELNKAVLTSN